MGCSCMAIVELKFGVSCDSFCPFFAEHLPYHSIIFHHVNPYIEIASATSDIVFLSLHLE